MADPERRQSVATSQPLCYVVCEKSVTENNRDRLNQQDRQKRIIFFKSESSLQKKKSQCHISRLLLQRSVKPTLAKRPQPLC